MANNCLRFSEQIDLADEVQAAWVRKQLGDSDGFEWEIIDESGKRTLLLFAEESGDPHAVARFVQAFLRRFRPNGSFSLTYAAYCEKPRLGEFGGGAIYVTAESIESFDTHEWVAERTRP